MTATHNRIAPFLNPSPSVAPPPAERQAAYTDAVFASVVALRGLLANPDPAVVLKAAEMILDLEKTRLRHDRELTGTAAAGVQPAADEPTPVDPSADDTEESEEDWRRIEFLRGWLQERADATGERRRVSRAEAEQLYRQCRPHLAEAGLHPAPG